MRENIAACGEILCDLLSVMLVLTRIFNFSVRRYGIRYWLAAAVLAAGSIMVFLDQGTQWNSAIYITVLFINVNLLIVEKVGKRLLVCLSMMFWVFSVNVLFFGVVEVILKFFNNESCSFVVKSLIAALSTLLLFFILANHVRKFTKGEQYVFPLFYYVIMMAFLAVDILAAELFYSRIKENKDIFFMLPALIMYMGMILETIVMIISVVSKYHYKELNLSNARSLVIQEKHYQRLRSMDEETRRLRHDIKNHIRAIQVLVRENKIEELWRYIERLESKLADTGCSISVNNDIVDAIVNEAAKEAEQKGIEFYVRGRLPSNCYIESIDLCIIFSNLLTNAIEACERTLGKREISLEIRLYEEEIFVVQYNTKPLERTEGRTWKTDKKNHGFGLRNIKESVEKYNGKVRILEEKDSFCVHILLKNMELVDNKHK